MIPFVNIRCDAICNLQFSSVSCDPNWKLRLKEWKFNLHPHYNLGRRQGQIAPKSCTAGHEIHPLRGTEICMHSCTSYWWIPLFSPSMKSEMYSRMSYLPSICFCVYLCNLSIDTMVICWYITAFNQQRFIDISIVNWWPPGKAVPGE